MRRNLPALVLALTLAAGLTACGDDGGDGDEESFPEPDTTEAPEGEPPEGVVVFTPEDSETDANGEPTTWTPTFADVLAAEDLLADELEANADTGVGPLDTYVRQYLGVGPDDGHLVSANALCEDSLDTLDDWEDELIVVSDGGDCFWQATVDLTTSEVVTFTVNGVA